MADDFTEELKHVRQHEILERRRSNVALIAFAAVIALVIVGLVLAFSSIGSTVR
jgi:hypothetical protein